MLAKKLIEFGVDPVDARVAQMIADDAEKAKLAGKSSAVVFSSPAAAGTKTARPKVIPNTRFLAKTLEGTISHNRRREERADREERGKRKRRDPQERSSSPQSSEEESQKRRKAEKKERKHDEEERKEKKRKKGH